MKAVVCHKYGSPDVLEVEEVQTPSPGDDEVLIRVHAASANALDWRLLRADPFFIRLAGLGFWSPKHKILGADVAGTVEAVGNNVRRFVPGDEVFGDVMPTGMGGFAEYVCTREDRLTTKPDTLTFEEAAAVPVAAVTAVQGLRDHGRIQAGHKVLITGAGGGVGTFAVQIAKALGAEVTGVCSTGKLELVRSLGADRVIDYTREDPIEDGTRYDLIFDVAAYRSILDYRQALGPDGIYVMVGGATIRFFQFLLLKPWMALTKQMKLVAFVAESTSAELDTLKAMLESGAIKPVIGRRHTLAEVPDALRYVEQGHTTGKVVVAM
ncbi:MAG: NAD(P)-dependent alcohol dehydrogenase [Deltaproteobacteria bacterium]|nr:NAD(P)-dependent alcohol dehydrogenase [Deltaproteobacteria bacterium]